MTKTRLQWKTYPMLHGVVVITVALGVGRDFLAMEMALDLDTQARIKGDVGYLRSIVLDMQAKMNRELSEGYYGTLC